MIPEEIRQRVGYFFSGNAKSIQEVRAVGGGSINHAVQFTTQHKKYFLKWNDAIHYPGMFESEANGLRLIRSTNTLFVPEVLHSGVAGKYSFLLMEFLEPGRHQKNFWEHFGIQLAKMHRHPATLFGLDHDNYIGSLKQLNTQNESWADFFLAARLEPQFKMAMAANKLPSNALDWLENIAKVIDDIMPMEKPSLLHGDLWNGNFLVSNEGAACVIDPAVYYGHREMDLAMTKLFGGFDQDFYEAYHSEFPLMQGFEQRFDIYNLYPLLVHVNLFGGGYIQQVKNILSRF